jgi:hypothetical protein
MNIDQLKQRYFELMHAMQSGVAFSEQAGIDYGSTSPKHLRVGINSAMVNDAALTTLLLKKGIITEEEYWTALVEQLEKEVEAYKQTLSEHYGASVDLG